MTNHLTAAALALLAAVVAQPAAATVRYEAQSLTLTRPASNDYAPPEVRDPFRLEFVVSDAAVARGSDERRRLKRLEVREDE